MTNRLHFERRQYLIQSDVLPTVVKFQALKFVPREWDVLNLPGMLVSFENPRATLSMASCARLGDGVIV